MSYKWIVIPNKNDDRSCFDIAIEQGDGFTYIGEFVYKPHAYLATAAPDFMDAALDMIRQFDQPSSGPLKTKDGTRVVTTGMSEAVDKLRAAIAKATPETE